MELRHLRYFAAVAEEENVTRAAARLNVSQPPVSRQIRDLEEELGVELFKRTAKSLHLTEAGHLFLAEARSILLKVDVAVTNVRAVARGVTSALHVGYAPSPTSELLPHLLPAFEAAAPGTRVILHEMTSAEMIRGLRTRQLQAALMVEHPGSLRKGLIFHPLLRERAGLLLPRNHALATRRRLRPEEVVGQPMAVYSPKEYPDYHDWLHRIFGKKTRRLQIAEECDGALSLIAAVHARGTLAVVAESIQSIAGSRAVFIPLSGAPPIRVGICYPEKLLPGSPANQFVETARQVASE